MAKSLLPFKQRVFVLRGIRGAVVVWVMDGEDHLNVSDGVEYVVSETNDGVSRFGVCGGLGYQLVVGLEALLRTGRARRLVVRLDLPTATIVVRLARIVGYTLCRQRTCACW